MENLKFLSPINTGLKGRCLRCGEGSLFVGFLKFARNCQACGLNFDVEDAGDGPAVFVIFLAGIFIVPMALAFQLILNTPVWITFIIWAPILTVSCIAMLRPLRGLMLNVQIKNDAQEAKIDDVSGQAS